MLKNPLRIYENVLEAVGYTPMIRINKIAQENGILCQLYAKSDFYSVGGSIKDRIGVFMIEEAEKRGRIRPGDTIVESTSGNTGIGLALSCLVKGYKLIITLPDKMSDEKINVLKALGAEVIITPTDVDHDHPDSYTSVAKRIGQQPNTYHIDQYNNPDNMLTHYQTTGEEIYEQMEGKIDYVFIGAGTCGTITGVAKKLHEKNPNIKVIGIDPVGSVLARPAELNQIKKSYKIEGVGQSMIPSIMDYNEVYDWIKVDDPESLVLARDLITKEGLLVGGSCGTAMLGAINYLKQKGLNTNPNLRCVVILPDSIRNYMTKMLSDNWMVGHGFYPIEKINEEDHPLANNTMKDLTNLKPVAYYDKRLTVSDCFDLFKRGLPIIPIRENGEVIGVITKESLVKNVATKGLHLFSSCSHCIKRDFLKVN